ncbi:hypothetical protein V8E36_009164 [Tilletia maclaganii]
MFIALIGPPCAGKESVASFLQQELGFQRMRLLTRVHHSASAPALDASTDANKDNDNDGSNLTFDSADALLEHATTHWREPLLTLDLSAEHDIRAFLKRPFFLLIGVQAPLLTRWRRYQYKHAHSASRVKTLEQFITLDDRMVYGLPPLAQQNRAELDLLTPDVSAVEGSLAKLSLPRVSLLSAKPGHAPLSPPASNVSASSLDRSASTASLCSSSDSLLAISSRPEPLASLFPKAALVLTNAHPTLDDLHASLHALQLPATLPTFLRPAWDHYFLSLCSLASLRSNCMKRRVGAVLVRSNRVLSTGYNGTPRGMKNCNEGGCARCNGGAPGGARLDECLCLHAEENALLECGRERGGAEGTVLYCNTCPCLRCAVKIVQTGVREVVYELDYSMDDRSRQIFEEAGVKFRKCLLPTAQR